MENPVHSMANLFSQLGLASSNDAMTLFVRLHTLSPTIELEKAPFWSPSQIAFLLEARADDSDWSELVDQLDVMLHQPTWH
ncbi:DUF2789 domain-containing protein [Chitinibacter bivalviorum]|uniref:DUF2789 domain-containing protein n=1 Tax=Chitinibacter bivalviorum TaxID=2739434 RepID=A0A7H9BGB1_9NEIS|nr:DUF2789 family protein [Chitinibacter bivalviorum]QLG87248.1 DUF2789 domain-containing protein [Chitinibacter bivalviorum]